MKRIVVIFVFLTLLFNDVVFAGREYILKYAYPDKVKKLSIYDILGKGYSKNYKRRDRSVLVLHQSKNYLLTITIGNN